MPRERSNVSSIAVALFVASLVSSRERCAGSLELLQGDQVGRGRHARPGG